MSLLLNEKKRSETFNQNEQLPSIPEVPDHLEKTGLKSAKKACLEPSIKKRAISEQNNLTEEIKNSSTLTPQQLRQRHRAGQIDRKVSTEDLILIRNVNNFFLILINNF